MAHWGFSCFCCNLHVVPSIDVWRTTVCSAEKLTMFFSIDGTKQAWHKVKVVTKTAEAAVGYFTILCSTLYFWEKFECVKVWHRVQNGFHPTFNIREIYPSLNTHKVQQTGFCFIHSLFVQVIPLQMSEGCFIYVTWISNIQPDGILVPLKCEDSCLHSDHNLLVCQGSTITFIPEPISLHYIVKWTFINNVSWL